jgi:hypothetical protein
VAGANRVPRGDRGRHYAMGLVLPLLRPLLLKYPIAELAAMLLKRLAGL